MTKKKLAVIICLLVGILLGVVLHRGANADREKRGFEPVPFSVAVAASGAK